MGEEETAGDYEVATGQLIVERFSDLDPGHTPMVLVARHGAFAWGPTAAQAVENGVMLEETARIAWLTVALDPGIGSLEPWLAHKHFQRKHGQDAYYGQQDQRT